MVKLTIDSMQFEAAEGTMVLDVANTHNIYIPTLCNHEAVSPYGACRLCTVEVSKKNGRKRLVTPCLYPVEDGMVVVTNSEKVSAHRRTLMKLLMARCPESEVVKKLAQKSIQPKSVARQPRNAPTLNYIDFMNRKSDRKSDEDL